MSPAEAARLPAGPRGKWWSTWQLLREPRETFERWSRQYGDPFLVPALNGQIVLTGRPDLIRQIYGADPDIYGAFATETLRPLLGNGSLLLMDGATHRRERKLVMPMFHGDRMKAYGTTIQQVALSAIESRMRLPSWMGLDFTTSISLEVIVRAIFGAPDAARVQELLDASRLMVRNSSPLLFFSKRMQFSFLGISPWDRFQRSQHRLFAAFDRELAERQKSKSTGEDILSLLSTAHYEDGTAITKEHMRDALMTFLFAGHETSALAMAWAFYHLHRNPETLEKLRAELDAAPDDAPSTLAQLPYLKGVVSESLRLHPLVTEVLRLLKEPLELGEYLVPPGHGVAAAAVLAHYRPETYPEPDRFRPERFVERSYSPFEYMPFGGGHRRCVGAAFATYEMVIVLGTLLKRFEFELLEKGEVVPRRRNVTMGPSTGILLRVKGTR